MENFKVTIEYENEKNIHTQSEYINIELLKDLLTTEGKSELDIAIEISNMKYDALHKCYQKLINNLQDKNKV